MMDALIQTDIFFFVTTVVTIVIGIIGAIVLTCLAFLLNDLRQIAKTVRRQADLVATDVDDLRKEIQKEGVKVKSLVNFTQKIYKRSTKKK